MDVVSHEKQNDLSSLGSTMFYQVSLRQLVIMDDLEIDIPITQ